MGANFRRIYNYIDSRKAAQSLTAGPPDRRTAGPPDRRTAGPPDRRTAAKLPTLDTRQVPSYARRMDPRAQEPANLIALNIDEPLEIARYLGIDQPAYETLEQTAAFQKMLTAAKAEAAGADTAVAKTKAMARMASPAMIQTLIEASRCADPKVAKDAAETILNVAGVATKPAAAPVAAIGGVSINLTFTQPP